MNPARILLLLAFASFLLVVINLDVSYPEWLVTHWRFNYEHGFVKRGLVGQLYLEAFGEIRRTSWILVNIALIFCAAALATAFVAQTLTRAIGALPRDQHARATLVAGVLGLAVVSSPGGVVQYAFDFGRFDVFGAVFIAFYALLYQTFAERPIASTAYLFGASVVAVLVHEALVFWVCPILLVAWLSHGYPKALRFGVVALYGLAVTVCTLIVVSNTYSDQFTLAEAVQHLTPVDTQMQPEVVEASLRVHYRSLEDNVAFTTGIAWLPENVVRLSFGTLYLAVFASAVVGSTWAAGAGFRSLYILALSACFLPVLLLPLAADHARWLAMVAFSLSIFLVACIGRHPSLLSTLSNRWTFVFLLLIVVNGALGPLGISASFPETRLWQVTAEFLVAIGALGT